MNIPPLLSRTPPPLNDSENIENSDAEFGNFVMSSDMGGDTYDDYQNVGKTIGVEDSASEDSGLCTGSSMGQAHSPFETSPTTGHKGLHNGEDHSFESLPLSDLAQGHKQSLQHNNMCDDAIIIGEMDGEPHIEVEQVETIIPNNLEEMNDKQNMDSVNIDGFNQEKSISSSSSSSSEVPSNPSVTIPNTSNSNFVSQVESFFEDEDGEFEEFQVFDSFDTNQFQTSNVESISGSSSHLCQSETNLADKTCTEWDQSSKQIAAVEETIDDSDEFTDFQTSSFPPTINAEQIDHSSLHLFHQELFTRQLDEVTGELSEISTEGIPTLIELVQKSTVWSHLYSLDETPAFRYQWASSLTNRKLLSALKIDSRNILSSLWNKSLKMGSLDGSSIDQSNFGSDIVNKDASKTHSTMLPKNIVPDAHFDWVGSGLINPLDSNADNSCVSSVAEFDLEPIKISQQAEEILSTLPDRSYLKKTYIVFKKIS